MAQAKGKNDIAAAVATTLNGSQAAGSAALNAVLDAISAALKGGESVTLTGFGTFEVREVKPRQIRALRGANAGQMVSIPAHKRPAFRAGSELVRAVEGK
jgi:DNA-binding protein HU-beta